MKRVLVIAAIVIVVAIIAVIVYLRSSVPSARSPKIVDAYVLKQGPAKRQSSPDTYGTEYESGTKAPVYYVVAVFSSAQEADERMQTIQKGFERAKSDVQQMGKKIIRIYLDGSTEISWTHGSWLCVISSTQKESAMEFSQALPY